jgi:hypothetical protein
VFIGLENIDPDALVQGIDAQVVVSRLINEAMELPINIRAFPFHLTQQSYLEPASEEALLFLV